MKILYVITKSEIGGAQTHVRDLAAHMKTMGNAVAIMAAPDGWLENEATKLGIRFYPNQYFGNSFNPLRLLKANTILRKTLFDFQPDLVHAHSSFAGFLARFVIRGSIPTIFTAHSFAFTDGAKWTRKIIAPIAERIAAKWTSKIICVSEYDRGLALRYKIAPAEKLVVIHNGVADAKIETICEEKIISVGRLAYPKEFVLLLQAYKASGVTMTIEIIGDGPDREKIEQEIKRLDLGSRVTLLGSLESDEVRRELAKSCAFILISKHEGLPMTILEAMAAGLPIIASRVGGVPEEVNPDCGILVENNIGEIANALKSISNEQARRRCGAAARARYEREFTLELFLKKTEDVYRELFSV